MFSEENVQLGFARNQFASNNADIMFAYENEEEDQTYDQHDANFLSYQHNGTMAYPQTEQPEPRACLPPQLGFN